MFDLFRSREKSVRILLGVLLGLIAISMLLYLIPGGPGNTGPTGENVLATVGDQKITSTDVERTLQNMTRGQQNLPRTVMAMYVPSVVNQLIESKAMAYKARQMGLQVSDQELGDTISGEFSAAMGGNFDMKTYQMVLAQQGMTVAEFEAQQREAMLAARLENLEAQSLVVSDQDARAEYQRKNLKVALQFFDFEPKDFASKVDKSPAALKAYFDGHRALFRIPEKRDLDIIVGNTADFVQSASISDAQLHQQYQDNIDSYRTPERVKVRHILIKTQGKPKPDVPKLKAKADDILNQLHHGGDFAELAKKNSEDPGSGEKGGELGWIVKGQTVPNFEKTAFGLKPGELSGVVETEYGYHILQLEDKQAAHTQNFDEVKPQLLAEAQKQAAGELLKKAVDAARAEIAKNPSQAEAIAKKYNLRFFPAHNLARGDALPDVNSAPDLTNALFSAAKGATTDLVEIQNGAKQAFGVVTNVISAHNAEYADVEKDVIQKYTDAQSADLAQKAATAAAADAKKGKNLEAIAKEYGLTVKTAAPFNINGAAEGIGAGSTLSAAFKANVGDIVGPIAAQTGQFVCQVSQKIPADMAQYAQNKDSVVQELTQQRMSIQQPLFRQSVVDELKRRKKIRMNDAALSRLLSSYQS
ncbi:MAG: peptidylprolyl isomerase [Acidobacteriaceae bacterium]|nr:peptidylprolyl isomerase [Acidobacteriaceae bacterium]